MLLLLYTLHRMQSLTGFCTITPKKQLWKMLVYIPLQKLRWAVTVSDPAVLLETYHRQQCILQFFSPTKPHDFQERCLSEISVKFTHGTSPAAALFNLHVWWAGTNSGFLLSFFFFFSNPFPHPSPKIRSFQNTNLVEAMSSRKQMNGLKQGEWKHWLDCQAQRWWLMIQHVTGSYGWHSEKADRACYLHQQLREWDRMHIQQGCGWLQIRGGR